MSNNPDQIRNDIERTRADLELDVDALAERVRPSNVAHRQADKARGAMMSVKDRVMGTAHDAQERMHQAGDRMGEGMEEGQQKAAQKVEGHPLAVGLMAFGAGLLISALIPASQKEHDLAENALDRAKGMKHDVADVAKNAAKDAAMSGGKDIAGAAVSGAKEVADTAKDAAKNVASEGASAAKDVKDTSSDSASNVKDSSKRR